MRFHVRAHRQRRCTVAFEITAYQMGIFFVILLAGFILGKLGFFKQESMASFAGIITRVLLPALIIHNTVASTTRDMVFSNWPVVVFGFVFYAIMPVIMFGIAKLLRLPGDRDRVFTFCFTFGNTGFIGIPLLSALFPDYGLLFMALFSIADQLCFWTYGVQLSTARDRGAHMHLKDLISPNTVALVIAFIFVFADCPLPGFVNDVLGALANATSALCMMYLGLMLCFSRWKSVLKMKELYVGIAVKMFVLPILVGHLLLLTGLPQDMMTCMVIICSLPVMTVVPMLVRMHGDEGDYAAGITVVTLVASVVTIPLVQLIAFA